MNGQFFLAVMTFRTCRYFEASTIGSLNSHQFYTELFALLLWKHRVASTNALQAGTKEIAAKWGAKETKVFIES